MNNVYWVDFDGKEHRGPNAHIACADGIIIGSSGGAIMVRQGGKTTWNNPGRLAMCAYCKTTRDDAESLAFRGPLFVKGTPIPGATDFYCGCRGWE